jgi:hypothetical protein
MMIATKMARDPSIRDKHQQQQNDNTEERTRRRISPTGQQHGYPNANQCRKQTKRNQSGQCNQLFGGTRNPFMQERQTPEDTERHSEE